MTPQKINNTISTLGEGPVWDEREQCLWWTDILSEKIFKMSADGTPVHTYEIGVMVGTIGLCEDSRLILATADGFAFFEPESGKLESIADPESHLPGNRFNDGKPDPLGQMVAGTMALQPGSGEGALYCLNHQKQITTIRKDVTISNGLAWNGRHDTFYYIDTPLHKIISYDFDSKTGLYSNPRTQFTTPKELGSPDGMCIDSEGMLWVAYWGGSAIHRWDPQTGKIIDSIQFPATQITCCAFGGPDLTTLFVTSAHVGLTEKQKAEQPEAGALFKVDTAVRGTLPFRFNG